MNDVRHLLRLFIALFVIGGVLAGCGGGDDEPDDSDRAAIPGPPDCRAKPELCA